ncbi:hypothetical protein ICN10_07370 [Polynucleobacter sp. 86C-FISCH]|uniref:hypothetical protein n=1 Tax=Polynucleobacter sp. 86C-FISCH TaxID=2689101 RepID=UPI001C0BD964|nr:hypothetical protein [Polynucleobacter sp. 86C-FISCH]MBU3596222.1 hypothetical protein [Polynucleobacter sp. 86C-FISCH]
MKIQKILILGLIGVLSACGGGGGSSSSSATPAPSPTPSGPTVTQNSSAATSAVILVGM